MKKAIAVLLALIMLLGCAPVMVFAEETSVTTAGTLESDLEVKKGDKLSVSATWTIGANLIVEEGATLTIEENGFLAISGTGRLYNNGTIIVKKNGAILSKGNGTGESGAPFYNDTKGTLTLNNNSYFCVEKNTYAFPSSSING